MNKPLVTVGETLRIHSTTTSSQSGRPAEDEVDSIKVALIYQINNIKNIIWNLWCYQLK